MTRLLGSDGEQGAFTRESPNVKREIEQKLSKHLPNFDLLEGLRVMGITFFDFYCKRHTLA